MDENNTQQPGGFPDTTGYVNPQQPDTTGYMNPPQSDMTGYANPQQPDMTGYYGQQPGQPDMTGYYGQQPGQPDMTGYYGQQPGQPDMTGYYGQQPGQPDMTGYYGQQSMQPQTGGKKPKKPMTKGKLGALIGAGVAIVALVVCGVIFLPKLFKSDKEVVLDAMEETFSSYSTGGERNDVVGFDEVMKAYNEKGGDSSLNLTFNAGEGENAYAIGWNQNNAVDQKNKKLSADGAITIGGDDLLSYEVFGDEDTMTVGIPELLAGYLVYPADDPMGALANSPAGQSLGLDASALTGYSLNAFASGSDGSGLTSGYVSALETIWDAAEFKKQGSAKITVNGENVTAKEYYVTWAKEDLQDACVSAIDGLTEAVTGSQDTLDQLGMSADDYTYYMDQLKAAVPSVIKHDLCVKVYVKGKRAVKITCSDKINILNMVKIDYDFWLDAGKDDLSGNLSFDVSDTSVGVKFEAHDISGNTYGNVKAFAGDKEIGLDFTKDVVESGDTVTTKVKISASSYLSVDWEKTFNKADNTFENTVNANIVGADTYVFNYKGAYKDINKGVGYTVAIDSFELKAANQTLCNGSIDTTIDTSKISVQEMDASKKVYDLATMTEDDLQTFGEESQKLMDAWVEHLSDNTAFVNLIDALNSLFGTNSDLLNQVEEDIDEDTATYSDADFSDDNTDEITLDNASVMTYDGSAKYKIKGCIDGFNFEYANEYGVMFETEQVSTIQYGLYTAESASDALDSVYYDMSNIDSYEILDTQLNQTAKVEDKDVLYNVQTYNAFQMKCMDVTAVIEVEPGVFLSMEASIYLDDDDYTVEQLLQALESKYYEKIQ